MSQAIRLFTGLDVGDRKSAAHILDRKGELQLEVSVSTTRDAMKSFFGKQPRMRIALEVGTHSPWLSALLESLGHEVLVANARRLKAIYGSEKKTDRVDAAMLARIGRMDPTLLHPIRHRGETCQRALCVIRSREALVKSRTALINHVRGVVKSHGFRVPKGATYSFARRTEQLPDTLREPLQPVIDTVADLSARIRRYDGELARLAESEFPEAIKLQQIHGVGPLISLAFVAIIEDPHRFRKTRDVGAYLGLCPRVSQSGSSKHMGRITKAGDPLMRKLLVQGAHHLLGWRGVDCDLRRWGLRKMEQHGGHRKRTIAAVSRKLAVLMLSLWKTGEAYVPLRQKTQAIA